jgi:hypothetical protein
MIARSSYGSSLSFVNCSEHSIARAAMRRMAFATIVSDAAHWARANRDVAHLKFGGAVILLAQGGAIAYNIWRIIPAASAVGHTWVDISCEKQY